MTFVLPAASKFLKVIVVDIFQNGRGLHGRVRQSAEGRLRQLAKDGESYVAYVKGQKGRVGRGRAAQNDVAHAL
jgi:hypothetical protein